MELKFVV